MTRQDGIRILIGARHYCFIRGIILQEDGFRLAFRTLNRCYVELRDEMNGGQKAPRKLGGRPRKYRTHEERKSANAQYQRDFRLRVRKTPSQVIDSARAN